MYQVDAFADTLFSGNPAAVLVTDVELDENLMSAIAAENNLAETAFVTTRADVTPAIRWFTPTVEVDLCGHATLASAHVLYEHLGYTDQSIEFSSRSGILSVTRDNDLLVLDFPSDNINPVIVPDLITNAIGDMPLECYRGRDDYFAVYETEDEILSFYPDMSLLQQLDSRGLVVTSPGKDVDFVSRFFAPQSGIPEDPVTGSSHTALTPFWTKRLSKKKLTARQVSARGGTLICENCDDRVRIGGNAVTFLIGEIFI